MFHMCLLSSVQQMSPNVMKINVKINTMQNTNSLLFVRSLSFTKCLIYDRPA